MAKIQAKLAKGLIGCGYAPITIDSDTNEITYGDIKWLPSVEAGSRTYSAAPRGETTPIYADGIIVYADNDNDGYDVTLTLLSACDNVETDWFGNTVTANGIAEYSNSGEFPKFALLIREQTTDDVGRTTVYYNCQCANRTSTEGKTKESGAFEFAFPEYTITATPKPIDMLVRYTINSKEKFSKVPVPTDEEV